ncbi:discoidin domain-containing protein [Cellulomonas hominis]|uniref:discoidin domain-containing protein n=1 Tax=Cellulomonas hominis TaxID=156981 RepID=UPI0027DEF05D|nr:polysaccharide lyase family 8 super-sandwich domain-containing protein [Cellulomonas hominis]
MRHLRAVIALALALVLGGAGLAGAPRAAATPAEDVGTIISRLQEYYLGQGDEIIIANGIYLARTSEARDYAATLRADGSWADVDYADRTSSANGRTWSAYIALYRMLAMAHAYRDPAADGFEDPALVTAVGRALAYWDVADPGNTNWWETEIGESMAMGRISIFLGDVLDPAALDVALEHNTGRLDPVGANGAWRTTNYLFEAVATHDLAKITAGFDTMVQTVAVDHSGTVQEAVQPDASFWAHGAQLYSEGYGMALFTNVALWADVARGTGLAFSRQHLDTIAFYIISGTRWMIRGEIGLLYLNYRQPKTIGGVTSHASEFIEPLTRMVRTDPLYATAYRAVLDGIQGKTRTNGVTGNRYFWRSELSSHLRDDYGIITRLNSSRTVGSEYRSTFRPEVGNEIVWNSAGATAIQVTNREYLDLGPAFDWFHYPGVTAPYTKEQTRGSTGNGGSFTGGVSDGTYGASVYTLDRAATKGQKSYFTFDDEMVALGTGISSTSAAAVHTTVNQVVAKPNASVNGAPVAPGTDDAAVDGPAWAYNDEVGYVFPAGQRVLVSNTAQTGSWIGEDPVTVDAFTLYVDHGVQPQDAGYEYVVLPAATPAEVEAYAAAPAVEVLRNDWAVQAVRHAGLQRTMATFSRAGSLDLGDGRSLAVDQASLVILDESGDVPVVSVANPGQPGIVVRVSLTGPDGAAHGVFALGSGATLGKTVTAALAVSDGGSSPYSASSARAGHGAALAGDGDAGTAWRSAAGGTQWLTRQLAHGSFVTGATVTWGEDAATRFLLQTSADGVTWTDQRFTQDGTGGTTRIDIAPTAAGFVRLLLLDGDGDGYAVRELEVDASVNLALGGAVSVSGTSSGAAGSITDGNMATRWSGNLSDGAWAQVDLGSVQPVGTVRLWWEASYARQYRIQVSDDGSAWRDAYATSGAGSDGGVDVVALDEQARYVRMQTVQRSTTQYGVSIWELEVFGDDAIASAPSVPAGRENLALGREVTADSQYNATLPPANAVDGNPTTRWASLRQDAPYTTERWLQVDLGSPRTINQVVLTWETATSNDFRVEGSADGQTWQLLARVQKTSAELKNTVDFADTEVRHVRVAGLPVTKYGMSLFELEVYGGYKLACTATGTALPRDGSGVLTATIAPHEADDVIRASSLDPAVAAVTGAPRVAADGSIGVDLATGSSGSTSVLISHDKGDELVWCPVSIAVATQDLQDLVARADGLESERYTPASWAPLLPALEAAKALLASAGATQAEVDAAAAALASALDGLAEIPPADTTAPVVSATVEGRVVTVVATDEGGSGVASVEYRLGSSGAWTAYAEPVAVPGTDAVTVEVRATDGAGNVSAVGSVRVEAVPPGGTAPAIAASAGTVRPGDRVTVTLTGMPGDEVEVGIASVYRRLAAVAVTDGSATAEVTIPGDLAAGTHHLQARGADGALLAQVAVVVEAAAPGSGAPGAPGGPGAQAPGGLAVTGGAIALTAVLALALLALGAALTRRTRRG